jgi:hypothetical protein
MGKSSGMNTDELPDWASHVDSAILIGGVILAVLVFPTIAALVAPDGRRFEFFLLTLIVLWGPIGVACAAVANPRP